MATFAHQLLVMAECSTPLLGIDILSKVSIQVIFSIDTEEPVPIMALFIKRESVETDIDKEQELNSQVWATTILV